MGFLSRIFGRKATPPGPTEKPDDVSVIWISGDGVFEVPVAGESHYQDALLDLAGGRAEEGVEIERKATLVLEDSNPHDPKAVAVEIGGQTVGHLSRENARAFRDKIGHLASWGVPVCCQAQIRGGWDRGPDDQGNFGVWLDFTGS